MRGVKRFMTSKHLGYSGIRWRRKEAGKVKNESATARVLSVTPQALSNYKKRDRMPSHLVIKFASIYGLSVDWLLTGNAAYRVAEEGSVFRSRAMEDAAGMVSKSMAALTPEEMIYTAKVLQFMRNANKITVNALKGSVDAFARVIEEECKATC